MYSNDSTQIQNGMVNYIGALISASKLPPKAARHDIVATLIEESLKLAEDMNTNEYDLYILKPLLRANVIIFEQQINKLNNGIKTLPKEISDNLSEQIQSYENLISIIKSMLKALEENVKF